MEQEKQFITLKNDLFNRSSVEIIDGWQQKAKGMARRVESGIFLRNLEGKNEGDKVELSFPRKQLTILCAPSGHGKTTTMLNVGIRMAMNGKKGFLLTMEEPDVKLAAKMMSIFERIVKGPEAKNANYMLWMLEHEKFYQWDLHERFTNEILDRLHIIDANADAESINSYEPSVLYDPAMLSEMTKRVDSDNAKRRVQKMDFIMMDYLQLMNAGDFTESSYINMKKVMQSIRNLCGQNDVAVIGAAQLNRGALQTDFMEWDYTLLREGADLEFTANMIVAMRKFYENGVTSYGMRLLKNRDGNPMQAGMFATSFEHQYIDGEPTPTIQDWEK